METSEMDRHDLIEYAGFRKRFFAFLVDTAIMYVFSYGLGLAIGITLVALKGHLDLDSSEAKLYGSMLDLALKVFYLLCISAMESSSRQATPGKRLLGIIVTDLQGNRVSYNQALARNLAKLFSNLTLGYGYLMCTSTKRAQTLHDSLAECLVIIKD
jgi:eukaryotic-like serine/threonine-protein kinase